MKIMFPKEMKIRTACNVLGIAMAIVDSVLGVLLLVSTVLVQDMLQILFSALALTAGGLYFIVVKTMWSLSKAKKKIGKPLVLLVAVLGIAGAVLLMISPEYIGLAIAYLVCIGVSVILMILVHRAEAALIEKKFLVYTK